MTESAQPDTAILQTEIARLNKIIKALMDRAERTTSLHGSDFNLFQTAITLEEQVRLRTAELEAALRENERIARDLRESEKQIRHLAFYDALTQLANRRLLIDRLGQALTAGKRSGRYGALIFLDLDTFKPLNDAHGHEAGDLLLVEAARRLIGCVREVDTVARMGGDEFVVLLGELDPDEKTARMQAVAVAEKIRVTLEEPYFLHRDSGAAPLVRHNDHEFSGGTEVTETGALCLWWSIIARQVSA